MLADTVDYGEYKLGTRSESIVFSMQTMTVKFGNALAGFMASMTLSIVGYVPNQVQSESTLLGLRSVMFLVSTAIIIIMVLIYIKYYKLNGNFYKSMLDALEVSRSKAKAEKESRYIVRYALSEKHMLLNTQARTKEEIINKMVDTLIDSHEISNLEEIRTAILKREQQASTGIADGIAIPHAKCSAISKPQIVIATLTNPIDFNAADGKPTDLICLIASPDDGNSHLETIGRLSILLNDKKIRSAIRGVKDMGIVFGPFLFSSWEEAFKLNASPWYQEQAKKLEDTAHIKIISTDWRYGARHTLTTKPVTKLSDFHGLKIRVPTNQIQVKGFEVLGATPTSMALGEVYTSIQQGTIDGVENPLAVLYNGKFHEVAKYLLLDGHVYNVTNLVVGIDFYNSLTKEQQQLLTETCNEAAKYQNEIQEQVEQDILNKFKQEGVTITTPSPEFKADLINASKAFYSLPEFSDWSENLYDTVKQNMQ